MMQKTFPSFHVPGKPPPPSVVSEALRCSRCPVEVRTLELAFRSFLNLVMPEQFPPSCSIHCTCWRFFFWDPCPHTYDQTRYIHRISLLKHVYGWAGAVAELVVCVCPSVWEDSPPCTTAGSVASEKPVWTGFFELTCTADLTLNLMQWIYYLTRPCNSSFTHQHTELISNNSPV